MQHDIEIIFEKGTLNLKIDLDSNKIFKRNYQLSKLIYMSNSSKISSEDVVEYLKENPDFFNLNPESLNQINLKHESGDAISLIEKQIIELRKSSDQANKHLIQILENAKERKIISALERNNS